MIGARDMAFPLLNMLSFWVAVLGAVIMTAGFLVEGGHAASGWTGYAPLSTVPEYTGVFMGQTLWALSLFVLSFSSLMGSINYITTLINMRTEGMTWFRVPLVVWSLFVTAILGLLALPILGSAGAMMIFDRVFETNFFNPRRGANPSCGSTCSGISATRKSTSSSFRAWASLLSCCPFTAENRSSATGPWCTPCSPSPSCRGSSGATTCSSPA